MSADRRAMVLMAAFVAAWAAVEALGARLARPYSPLQVVFVRHGVTVALVLALGARGAPAPARSARRLALQAGRSLLLPCVAVCWLVAFQRGARLDAVLAGFWALAPLLVVALAWAVAGERPAALAWVATAAASVAAVAAVRPRGLPPLAAAAAVAAMAGCFALYVATARLLRDEPTRANVLWTAAGASLALAVAMPGCWLAPSPRDLALMVAIGAVGAAELWALDRVAKAAPLAVSAPLLTLQVVFLSVLETTRGSLPGAATAVALAALAAVSVYAWHVVPCRSQP